MKWSNLCHEHLIYPVFQVVDDIHLSPENIFAGKLCIG